MMSQPAQCNESRKHYRHQHQHPEHNRQEKQKVTVSFLTIFAPRLDDRRPVPDDAIRKNKIATRFQPHEHDNHNKKKQRKESDCYLQPRLPLVKMRRKYVLGLARLKISERRLKISERRWEIDADASKVSGQKRREANHEPFHQIEPLKENLLRQLERFTKRFEDFDLRLGSIHAGHFRPLTDRYQALHYPS